MRIILTILLFLVVKLSYGFDVSNSGYFAIVHKDGHVTKKIFRVSKKNNKWSLEDKKRDGTWQDVTCEQDCILSVSTNQDIERFMGGKPPKGITAECIHNSAFAFCSLSKTGMKNRKYLLVALVTKSPIPIKLKRLDGE